MIYIHVKYECKGYTIIDTPEVKVHFMKKK